MNDLPIPLWSRIWGADVSRTLIDGHRGLETALPPCGPEAYMASVPFSPVRMPDRLADSTDKNVASAGRALDRFHRMLD